MGLAFSFWKYKLIKYMVWYIAFMISIFIYSLKKVIGSCVS